MRKLIERCTESLIVCDNITCDFKVPYKEEHEEYIHWWINRPCPNCGDNLLTYEDYLRFKKVMRAVNFMNRWFSWITIFCSNKRSVMSVQTHNEIKVYKD